MKITELARLLEPYLMQVASSLDTDASSGDNASTFVVLAASSTLVNERILTAGNGVTLTDSGPGAAITLAVVNADFVTLSAQSGLASERVLTAGNGISLVDGGAGSTITVKVTPPSAIGDMLFSVDGSTWSVQVPLASDDGGWMTNDTGNLLVVG